VSTTTSVLNMPGSVDLIHVTCASASVVDHSFLRLAIVLSRDVLSWRLRRLWLSASASRRSASNVLLVTYCRTLSVRLTGSRLRQSRDIVEIHEKRFIVVIWSTELSDTRCVRGC
jgi:hypothetical protein